MASFTAVNDTLELFVPDKGETIAIAISGTYNQVIDLQLELGSKGSGAWQTIKQFSTEDATEAFDYITKSIGENLRMLLRTDDGGDAAVTLTDSSDKLIRSFKDSVGNNLLELRQSGTTVPGTLTVDGTSSFTGAITGAVTLSGTTTLSGVTTLTGNTQAGGAGFDGIALVHQVGISRVGDLIHTQIFVDLTGLTSAATDNDLIGDEGTGEAWFARITDALNGSIYKGKISCFETPTTGEPSLALWAADVATGVEDTQISALTGNNELEESQGDGTDWAAGDEIDIDDGLPTAGQYLYLVVDTAGDAGTYDAGQLLFEFWGRSV